MNLLKRIMTNQELDALAEANNPYVDKSSSYYREWDKAFRQGFKIKVDVINKEFARNVVGDYDRQFKLDSHAYTKAVNYTPEDWFDAKYK